MSNEMQPKPDVVQNVLNLERVAVAAMADLLANTMPRGRAEIRFHSQLFKTLNSSCRKFKDTTMLDYYWEAGSVALSEKSAEYLFKILLVRLEQAVPGALAEGYAYLIDLLEEGE